MIISRGNGTKKELHLEKNVVFAGLTSMLTDTTTKMIYSVMPMFLLSIGASKTHVSLIEGVAESTASLLKALSGLWSDKVGRNKPFMVLGYILTAIIAPLYSFAMSPFHILYLRFIERIGKGIRTAPRDSLIAGSAKGKAGKNFGIHKAMDNCGAIFGPLLSFAILSASPGNYRMIFLLAVIPASLGVVTIILFIKEAKVEKKVLNSKFCLKKFPKTYYFFLFIVFIFTLGNSTDALLLVKTNEVGITAAQIPLVYLLFNAVSVIMAIPMGVLSDKIGREKLIIVGYFIYSITYYGFGRINTKIFIILLFILYGVYSAATDGVQKALVSDLIDKNYKGTGLGIYNALLGITLLPASVIAGLLYDKVNASAPFYFGSLMSFCAAVMMIVFNKRKIKYKL